MPTPISNGAKLSRLEVESARSLSARFEDHNKDLSSVAKSYGALLNFMTNEEWPFKSHGCIIKMKGEPYEIWIKRGSATVEALTLFEELHHLQYAKKAVGFTTLSKTEVAKNEGRAVTYASVTLFPVLPKFESEEDVYRLFGQECATAAFYRIQHFRQQGW